MKKCQSCHKGNEITFKFCVYCGAPLTNVDVHMENTESNVSDALLTPKDKPVKESLLKNRKSWLIGLILLILPLATYFSGKVIYEPHKVVDEFEQAYIEEDTAKLASYFEIPKESLSEIENEAFIQMVKQYGWTNLKTALMNGIDSLKESDSNLLVVYDEGGNGFITLHKKPVMFRLFEEVTVRFKPVELYVVAPYAGTKVIVSDQEINVDKVEEPVRAGFFLPGEHTVTAQYQNQLGEFNLEDSLYIGTDGSEPYVIQFGERSVDLDSDIQDAVLFINNETTNQTIDEIQQLYPVPEDSNVEVFAEYMDADGTIYRSSAEKLNEDYVYLSFEEYNRRQESMALHEENTREFVANFRDDYLAAIMATDFNFVSVYFEDETPIYDEYKKFVEDHAKFGVYSYNFLVNDITSFVETSENEFKIETFETFEFSSEKDGQFYYERSKEYTIVYIDDRYYFKEIKNLDSKKTKI
ncbi:hypothetical protein LC048_00270 [Mesobacillus subterraneus]|uniref:TcaA NTF2-like domain-containing protein n=1 Tax=Mesobacillus subterraneus TaxID=285983 RepID=UPI001CFCFB21|nr:hypothetical protein [Mesobacillus subterraneus]WLR55498.1 hypothetical protein LC048_00270 [Mesobacillus subterraneus]